MCLFYPSLSRRSYFVARSIITISPFVSLLSSCQILSFTVTVNQQPASKSNKQRERKAAKQTSNTNQIATFVLLTVTPTIQRNQKTTNGLLILLHTFKTVPPNNRSDQNIHNQQRQTMSSSSSPPPTSPSPQRRFTTMNNHNDDDDDSNVLSSSSPSSPPGSPMKAPPTLSTTSIEAKDQDVTSFVTDMLSQMYVVCCLFVCLYSRHLLVCEQVYTCVRARACCCCCCSSTSTNSGWLVRWCCPSM